MKYRNTEKKYGLLELQLFAEEGAEGGSDGDDSGEGDNQDDDESDKDGDDEKKFSQKDMDEAVKKRLAREKRRWQREQQKSKQDGDDDPEKDGDDDPEKDGKEDKETKALKEKAAKADDLELKWTCLEHDVDKACVDDVIALAKVHMAKDGKMDIEDAIDAVLKKYPQFKEGAKTEGNAEKQKGAWGERQKGGTGKLSGVEEAFLRKNPGLKID